MPRRIKSIAVTAPQLVPEWHPTKNGDRTPENTGRGSDKPAHWLCATCGHEWTATPGNRSCRNARGCPACGGLVANNGENLAVEFPAIAAEWHPDNAQPASAYRAHSAFEALWRCGACGHAWIAAIYSRARGHGCPVCGGLVPSGDTRLAATHPHLAAQWISCATAERTPFNTSAGSTLRVLWKCSSDESHTWTAPIASRTAGWGCRHCSNKIVTAQNALSTTHPELAHEWAPENDRPASAVVAGSTYHAAWICSTCARPWKAKVYSRAIDGAGCKNCVSATTSRQEEALRRALLAAGVPVEPGGQLIRAGSREWHCDIVSHALKLVVEFDGSYWHRDSARTDKSKSTNLRKAGWTVVRVREAPLEKLSEFDVVVPFRDDDTTATITLEHLRTLGVEFS